MESEMLSKRGRCYLELGGDAMNGPLIELRFAIILKSDII